MKMSKPLSILFAAYEDDMPRIEEVEKVNEEICGLYKKLEKLDKELLDEFDMAVGKIARAYLKMGFNGGFKASAELLSDLSETSHE